MPLDPADINAIAEAVVRRLDRQSGVSVALPAIIPFKLTVQQFRVAVQRSAEHIRRECRARNIKAQGRPYLIHTRELEKFNVDIPLAYERLKAAGLLPSTALARTVAPVSQPSAA